MHSCWEFKHVIQLRDFSTSGEKTEGTGGVWYTTHPRGNLDMESYKEQEVQLRVIVE